MTKANKGMSVFTMTMLTVAAVLSLRNLPTQADFGYSIIFYITAAAICFFVPSALISAELASGWPEDGGVMRGRIEKEMGILEEWKERYPAEVSGGELQRFSIARALGQRTEILLADEITAMLDLITQRQIWSALLKETQSRGISLVAVSHSQELLEKICSRILHLSAISG